MSTDTQIQRQTAEFDKIKTSRDYAKALRALADFLEAVPEFALPSYSAEYHRKDGVAQFDYHYEKDNFLSAVKAVGSGEKRDNSFGIKDELCFFAADGLLRLEIYKEAICRVVEPARPAVYACEPLLPQAEESEAVQS